MYNSSLSLTYKNLKYNSKKILKLKNKVSETQTFQTVCIFKLCIFENVFQLNEKLNRNNKKAKPLIHII